MKSPFKFALSFLSFGLAAAAPAVLAQDATPPPPPAAPADATPPPAPPADQPADQTPPPSKKGGGRRDRDPLKMLTEKLSLTPDEQQKVGDLLKAQHEQGMSIRQDTTLSDDDKKAKGRELMKSTHDQIRALLTPDQQKTFDSLPPMRAGGGGKKSENN